MNKNIFYAVAFAVAALGSNVESFCTCCITMPNLENSSVCEDDVPPMVRPDVNQVITNVKNTPEEQRDYVETYKRSIMIMRDWKQQVETLSNKESILRDIFNCLLYVSKSIGWNLSYSLLDKRSADLIKRSNSTLFRILAEENWIKSAIVEGAFLLKIKIGRLGNMARESPEECWKDLLDVAVSKEEMSSDNVEDSENHTEEEEEEQETPNEEETQSETETNDTTNENQTEETQDNVEIRIAEIESKCIRDRLE